MEITVLKVWICDTRNHHNTDWWDWELMQLHFAIREAENSLNWCHFSIQFFELEELAILWLPTTPCLYWYWLSCEINYLIKWAFQLASYPLKSPSTELSWMHDCNYYRLVENFWNIANYYFSIIILSRQHRWLCSGD